MEILRRLLRSKQISLIRPYSESVIRRALLYVPAADKRKLEKALKIEADCIILDCEDGVALNKKSVARENVLDLINKGKPKKNRQYDLAVRVNSMETDFYKDDMDMILSADALPDTILLPKVENSEQIELFAAQSSKLRNKMDLIVYIESAKAIINLTDICKTALSLGEKSNFRLTSLVFGGDDFYASIGATKSDDFSESIYARQKLVLVAKAFGLQAIDVVYIKYKDLEGLQNQSKQGARLGFTGKQVIHPGQVPVVQAAFLPSKEQVSWAKGLLEAFKEHQNEGKGAFEYQGSMIDMPTMKQAQNIMNLYKNSM